MNFSKTTMYSINILSFMATENVSVMSADYLHSKLEIPYQYLRQILTDLSKNGFISSSRGRKGGFTFAKRTEDIYIADIIESTEGFESFNKCILGFKECPFDKSCAMHETWQTTRKSVINVLKETSLHDLIK